MTAAHRSEDPERQLVASCNKLDTATDLSAVEDHENELRAPGAYLLRWRKTYLEGGTFGPFTSRERVELALMALIANPPAGLESASITEVSQ